MSDRHEYDHADDTALAELSELYQQAPAAEPSLELNERILAMARAETRVRRLPGRRLRRWSLPLSLAAVLVLAVSLVPLLQQQLPDTLPTRSTTSDSEVSRERERRQTPAAPAQPQMLAPSEAITADTPKMAPAPLPTGSVVNQAPAARESAAEAPAPLSDAAEADRSAAPVASTPAPSEPAAMEAPADAAPPALMSEPPARTAVFSDPERWLTWIRLLYRQGRNAEAEAELTAFRRQFPDYPLDSLDRPGEP